MRTVSDWIKKFKDLPPEESAQDQPVDWHKLEEEGLSWEMGRGVINFPVYGQGRATRRFLKWWWRLDAIGNWKEEALFKWSRQYEELELREIFGLRTAEPSKEWYEASRRPSALQELDELMMKDYRRSREGEKSNVT